MTGVEDGPVRDEHGRILDGVTFDSTDEEIRAAVARRDAEDARNVEVLRRMRRDFGSASYVGGPPDRWRP
ncbi:hypothetical protein [Nocardioides ultimimeridianus]